MSEKQGEGPSDLYTGVEPDDLGDWLKFMATKHAEDVLWVTAIRDDAGDTFTVRACVERRKGPA